MKTRGFNYLPSIQLGKKKQGLIYYISHNYYLLPATVRAVRSGGMSEEKGK